MSRIASVHARQILDSRGRPTVEVDITTDDGHLGRAAVPSGASTGTSEAYELRDGDPKVYGGLGVSRAVEHVNSTVAPALIGLKITEQSTIDQEMIELDGTQQLSRLGANAVLGVSLAACRAAALSRALPLYRYIAELAGVQQCSLPMPMVNILSGGLHARHGMDIQDFLAVPAGATSMAQAVEIVSRVRDSAGSVIAGQGLTTLVADEGGLSPGLATGREALELMVESIVRADLQPGRDVGIALDIAASGLWDPASRSYRFACEGRSLSSEQLIEVVTSWVDEFPIVSVEDALDEEDWDGWKLLARRLGDRVNLIGDDLFTTSRDRLQRGITGGHANGVLIKVNQNGTLSGTLKVVDAARKGGFVPVISARSGETEDAFISDLAVGTAAGQIKIGSLRCSDRLAKYNQLLRIAEDPKMQFAGMTAYPHYWTGGAERAMHSGIFK